MQISWLTLFIIEHIILFGAFMALMFAIDTVIWALKDIFNK